MVCIYIYTHIYTHLYVQFSRYIYIYTYICTAIPEFKIRAVSSPSADPGALEVVVGAKAGPLGAIWAGSHVVDDG